MKNWNYKKIMHILLLIVITVLIVASFYSVIEFPNESVEEYYYYALNGLLNSDSSIAMHAVKTCIIPVFLISVLLISLFYNPFKLNIKNKKGNNIYPFNFIINHKIIITSIISIIFVIVALNNIGLFAYIKNNIVKSTIFEDNYVALTKKDINFNEKRNLILIYIESLETSFFSKEHGGLWNYELTPELYQLYSLDNAYHFSSNKSNKGIENLYATGWTTASVISSNTGVPFKITINGNGFSNDHFLDGSYAIGDILKDAGYVNEVISGAKTSFGGLDGFFTKHGKYNIIDPLTIDHKLTEDEVGRWGFNDKYMFELAKERILKHIEDGDLFNETLIGIDTHPMDGFKNKNTVNKYKVQYENVYATESIYIKEFIDWLMDQEFYKNTTVVIIGDHLCMQSNFMGKYKIEDRGRYNLILNPVVSTDNTYNRSFTSIDMAPTILASVGANINKLGLGVSLFSDEKTLTEKYGLKKANEELVKYSDYYHNKVYNKK